MHSLLNILPQNLNRVEVWPFQHPDIFLLYPVRHWFARVLGIIFLLHDPISAILKLLELWPHIYFKNILWIKVIIIVSVTASFPGFVAVKQSQIITPPPPCLTVGLRCSKWYAVFGFCQTRCCARWPNNSTLDPSVQIYIFFPGTFVVCSDTIFQT